MRTTEMKRLYWVWGAMIQRCHNPNNAGYRTYGAKGIAVCERWRKFKSFAADMGLPPDGASIDRIDGAKGYEPGNCRWATRSEQNRNRPLWCRYFVIDGARLTMREAWSSHAVHGVTYRAFVKRIVTRGWSVQQALSSPPDKRGGISRRAA